MICFYWIVLCIYYLGVYILYISRVNKQHTPSYYFWHFIRPGSWRNYTIFEDHTHKYNAFFKFTHFFKHTNTIFKYTHNFLKIHNVLQKCRTKSQNDPVRFCMLERKCSCLDVCRKVWPELPVVPVCVSSQYESWIFHLLWRRPQRFVEMWRWYFSEGINIIFSIVESLRRSIDERWQWSCFVELLVYPAFSSTFCPRCSASACTSSVYFYRTETGWLFLWWRCERFRLRLSAVTCRWFSTTLISVVYEWCTTTLRSGFVVLGVGSFFLSVSSSSSYKCLGKYTIGSCPWNTRVLSLYVSSEWGDMSTTSYPSGIGVASAYASVNILDTSFTFFIMTRYVVFNAMVLDFVARGKMFSVMITTVTSLGK